MAWRGAHEGVALTDLDILVDSKVLQMFVSDVFAEAGLSRDDADFLAGCLVQTSLWGKDSHGVMRVPHYAQRLLSGAVNPRPKTKIVRGSQAFEIMDGDDGPGFVVGRDAMLRAIVLAREYNVGAVGVVRSSHFGAAALYARLAVDEGMVGIAMTNTAPKVVAPGGSKPITGSNPVAIGVPSYGEFPFMLDVSLSAVAGGKLLLAGKKGEKIPLGLALDQQGQPTDDAAAAFAGSWFPMGGTKGLGLSFAVDLLCGLITGGSYGLGMKSQYSQPTKPSGVGHMMIALRVEAVMPREELQRRMQEFVTAVKASPMQDDSLEMIVPGEVAYRTERDRRANGVPLTQGLYAELLALGKELGVSRELPPRASGRTR